MTLSQIKALAIKASMQSSGSGKASATNAAAITDLQISLNSLSGAIVDIVDKMKTINETINAISLDIDDLKNKQNEQETLITSLADRIVVLENKGSTNGNA